MLKFFLGTWSQTCVQDLEDTHDAWEELSELGATTIAISTEKVERVARFSNESEPNYHLVCDTNGDITREFGLLVRLPEDLSKAYRDTQNVKMTKHHSTATPDIALPATYVVDKSGFIVYASFSEDLQARANIEEVLQALANISIDQRRYLLICNEEDRRSRSFICHLRSTAMERSLAAHTPSSSLFVPPRKMTKSRSLMNLSPLEADQDPFRYCLQQEDFVDSFRNYLQRSYCVENLLFYLEATHYRISFDSISEEARKQAASRIIKTYLREGTDLQVNLDDETRVTAEGRFKRGLITEDLFADATRAVFRLMEHDSFPKWQRTRDFREVWRSHGSLASLRPSPVTF